MHNSHRDRVTSNKHLWSALAGVLFVLAGFVLLAGSGCASTQAGQRDAGFVVQFDEPQVPKNYNWDQPTVDNPVLVTMGATRFIDNPEVRDEPAESAPADKRDRSDRSNDTERDEAKDRDDDTPEIWRDTGKRPRVLRRRPRKG